MNQVMSQVIDASKPLPFDANTFDAVFCNDSMCHIPGRTSVLEVCACVCVFVCVCIINVCIYICMYVCMHSCLYECIYVCMYVGNDSMCHMPGRASVLEVCVCMYVCRDICMYVGIYVCLYPYVCMFISIRMCISSVGLF